MGCEIQDVLIFVCARHKHTHITVVFHHINNVRLNFFYYVLAVGCSWRCDNRCRISKLCCASSERLSLGKIGFSEKMRDFVMAWLIWLIFNVVVARKINY